MKKLPTVFLALAVLAAYGLVLAGSADAQPLGVRYRAGTAGFAAGQQATNITFSAPLLSTLYAVSIQPTDTAGFSSISECTYFNALKKRTDGFAVQHKRCSDGAPVPLVGNVSLDWIAIPYK